MDTLFKGLASLIIIIFLVTIITTPNHKSDFTELKKYGGHVVVQKDAWINMVIVQKNLQIDSTRHLFFADDIIYQNLPVGDTIDVNDYNKYIDQN